MIPLELFLVILFIVLHAFFSLAETSILNVRKSRLQEIVDDPETPEPRLQRANKILSFKSKKVTVVNRQQLPTPPAASESEWPGTTLIADCNQFWVTLKHIHQLQERAHSFPLSRVEINLDDGRNRLKVELAR